MANKKIWDLDRLVASANCFDVADKIGMRKRRCGSSTYVECVDGSHNETKINHNQLFRDGCHCYSCGASHNVYGMVRAYYANILGTQLDHDEICELIAETCGGVDEYLIQPNRMGQKKSPFPLTKEDLELIGLTSSSERPKKIVSCSEYKDDEHREFCDGGGYAKTEFLPSISIYSLYREDEDLFWEIVYGKISEAKDKAKSGYKMFKHGKDDIQKALVQLFITNYNGIVSLEEKISKLNVKQQKVS